MLIPFCSKIKGSGAWLTQGFGEKYYPQWNVGVEIFQTNRRLRPCVSRKPRTTFADKKGAGSVSLTSHKVEFRKGSESAKPAVENRKGGYLKMW